MKVKVYENQQNSVSRYTDSFTLMIFFVFSSSIIHEFYIVNHFLRSQKSKPVTICRDFPQAISRTDNGFCIVQRQSLKYLSLSLHWKT